MSAKRAIALLDRCDENVRRLNVAALNCGLRKPSVSKDWPALEAAVDAKIAAHRNSLRGGDPRGGEAFQP